MQRAQVIAGVAGGVVAGIVALAVALPRTPEPPPWPNRPVLDRTPTPTSVAPEPAGGTSGPIDLLPPATGRAEARYAGEISASRSITGPNVDSR